MASRKEFKRRIQPGSIIECDDPQAGSEFLRKFETGATRDLDERKLDFEGFFSPLVMERYAIYMDSKRPQADGSMRASDNWQLGIPKEAYIKSAWRHFFDFWKLWRKLKAHDNHGPVEIEDALCGLLFNASGFLHEHLKEKLEEAE